MCFIALFNGVCVLCLMFVIMLLCTCFQSPKVVWFVTLYSPVIWCKGARVSQSQSRKPPHRPSPHPCVQLNLFSTDVERPTTVPLFTTTEIICASFFFFQLFRTITLKNDTHYRNLSHRVVSTYHKPRLQQCIQRMQPTKGTHHWLHSSQRAETHTCHPGKRKDRKRH